MNTWIVANVGWLFPVLVGAVLYGLGWLHGRSDQRRES